MIVCDGEGGERLVRAKGGGGLVGGCRRGDKVMLQGEGSW